MKERGGEARADAGRGRAGRPRRRPLLPWLCLWAACAAGAGVEGARGQVGEAAYVQAPSECAVVRRLVIERSSIFAADERYADSFYGRWSNRLHVVTREGVVRRGLRFGAGDRVCREDLAAAIRRLRGYSFLHGNIDLEVRAAGPDSIDVTVRTRDIWTTRPAVQFRKDGGIFTWSASFAESNLLGLGKGLGIEVGQGELEPYQGAWLRDPQFLGQELLFYVSAFDGVDLWSRSLYLEHRFERAVTTWGTLIDARRYRGSIVDRRGGIDGPEWSTDQWLLTASLLFRVAGGDRAALRLGPSLRMVEESYRVPVADPGAAARCGPPLASRRIRGVGVGVDLGRESFSQRAGINSFFVREDFDLGTRVQLDAGWSPRAWGTQDDAVVVAFTGAQGVPLGPRWFLLGRLLGEHQWVENRFEDVRLSGRLVCYGNLSRSHTLAAALRHQRTSRAPAQAIWTLGANTGLRGFESYRTWGDRTLLLNLEERLVLVEDLLGLVTAGAVLFADTGLVWRTERHAEARPRIGLGLGLRLMGSRSRGSLVTRIDLGWPTLGREEGDGWILSIGSGQVF